MALTIKRFTANWCAPCKAVGPIIDNLATRYTDVRFETIDIEDNENIAAKYNVRSIPYVVFEKNGKVVHTIMGFQPESTYISAIISHKD